MITVTAYDETRSVCQHISSADDLKEVLKAWRTVWVQVNGTDNTETAKLIGDVFNIHKLALEDVLTTHQRAKIEQYGDIIFVIVHELADSDEFTSKQLCFFLVGNCVVSFQSEDMESLHRVAEKIGSNQGGIRSQNADYLAYTLLDAIIDTYFPVLENLGEKLEDLEDVVMENPTRTAIAQIHEVKRSLLLVRRTIWPIREVVNSLLRDNAHRFSEEVRFCLRDCYDHAVEIIDLTETYRELGADLMDVYLSSISNKMNEIMKVLTIIATIVAPPTLVATIYGMNFNTKASPYNMPELDWYYGYPFALALMVIGSCAIFSFIRYKGWLDLGSSPSKKG